MHEIFFLSANNKFIDDLYITIGFPPYFTCIIKRNGPYIVLFFYGKGNNCRIKLGDKHGKLKMTYNFFMKRIITSVAQKLVLLSILYVMIRNDVFNHGFGMVRCINNFFFR